MIVDSGSLVGQDCRQGNEWSEWGEGVIRFGHNVSYCQG